MMLIFLLMVLFPPTVLAGDAGLKAPERRVTWMETRCELGAAEVVDPSTNEVVKLPEVVCVMRNQVVDPPTVMDSSIESVACTKGGDPWFLMYVEHEPWKRLFIRSVLIDLDTHSWLLEQTRREARAQKVVERLIDENPKMRVMLFQDRLEEEGVDLEITECETNAIELPDRMGGMSRKNVRDSLKRWEDKVLGLLSDAQPDFLESLQKLRDGVVRVEDPDGRFCCFGIGAVLGGVWLPPQRLRVKRECSSEVAIIEAPDKSRWPEFWDKFSKWDTWPEFPNMKHFKF